ncbi:hypothetical protein J6590_062111 [Homalodisca vitripennis]|nr:hypothetical protein J6590_062111 [Homalodisca vitripennis]
MVYSSKFTEYAGFFRQLLAGSAGEDHFWLVYTFQLNLYWAQKPMCHLNLGNLMDVQERHINNRKLSKVLASLNIRVSHPLPALNGEAGSELSSPSFEGT